VAKAYDPLSGRNLHLRQSLQGRRQLADGLDLKTLKVAMYGLGGHLPDILWDGYVNAGRKVDGKPAGPGICIDNGAAHVLNADGPGGLQESGRRCRALQVHLAQAAGGRPGQGMSKARPLDALQLLVAAGACLLALAACSRRAGRSAVPCAGNPARLSDWNLVFAKGHRLELNSGVEAYETEHAAVLRLRAQAAHGLDARGHDCTLRREARFPVPRRHRDQQDLLLPGRSGWQRRRRRVAQRRRPGPNSPGRASTWSTCAWSRRACSCDARKAGLRCPTCGTPNRPMPELARAGDELSLQLQSADGKRSTFTYVVPNSNQCAGCHAPDNKANRIEPIGLKARHLNRDHRYGQGDENQSAAPGAGSAILSGAPAPARAPRNADWHDDACRSSAARAPTSTSTAAIATTARPGQHLRACGSTPIPENLRLGVCKPPVAAGQGTGDHIFDVVPGKPASRSFLSPGLDRSRAR
jgi:hypothetical protein